MHDIFGCLIQLNLYQESHLSTWLLLILYVLLKERKLTSCSKNERFIDRNPFGAFLVLQL